METDAPAGLPTSSEFTNPWPTISSVNARIGMLVVASGHVAAAPPSSVTNERRFMLISDDRRQVTPRLMEALRGGSTLGEFRDR